MQAYDDLLGLMCDPALGVVGTLATSVTRMQVDQLTHVLFKLFGARVRIQVSVTYQMCRGRCFHLLPVSPSGKSTSVTQRNFSFAATVWHLV